MRVFKLLQDLPDVQAGELFISREVDGVEKYFSTLEDDLRYDIQTVASNPVWFQEVEAVHAEFEKLKTQVQELLDKLTHLQQTTPDHVDVNPAIAHVTDAVGYIATAQAAVSQPQAPATPEQPQDQGLNPQITPAQVDPALDAQNDAANPSQAPEPTPTPDPTVAPVDIPVAPETQPVDPQATPESIAQTVEAPAQPDPVPTPPVVTNIEPNPFTS